MTDTTMSSMADHLGMVATGLEWIVIALELFAIGILLLGVARFATRFVSGDVMHRDAHDRHHQLNHGRWHLAGTSWQAGVLIVADLIRTILHLSLANILLLGRSWSSGPFISFMMSTR